jgi:hypothetical protein
LAEALEKVAAARAEQHRAVAAAAMAEQLLAAPLVLVV